MKIDDRVYGIEDVNEPVLIDLINSRAVQRLKGISQYGLPEELAGMKVFSRYEHSLGVMALLRRIGASIEEQIAGLTHDVSHTAFSHLVDWVVGDPTKENYQDNSHSDVVEKSDIPRILLEHGFDYRGFVSHNGFGLLEREAPSLCADRVDYALREMALFGKGENISYISSHLKNFRERIVFDEAHAAELFGRGYVQGGRRAWHSDNLRARYAIFAEALKRGLDLGIIDVEDFRKTDREIIDVLDGFDDEGIRKGLGLLRNGFRIREMNGREGGFLLVSKFRYVDPEVLADGGIRRLSEICGDYRTILEKERKEVVSRRVEIEGVGK